MTLGTDRLNMEMSEFNPQSLLEESRHSDLREFCWDFSAEKGVLALVNAVLQYTTRLRILYYFVKINQSFTQEIKSYIKRRSFRLLALGWHVNVLFLSITFKQLQKKKVKELEKYFLQLTIERPWLDDKKRALLKEFLADGPFTINQSLRSKNKR